MTAICHDIPLEKPPAPPELKGHFKNDIGYADAFVASVLDWK